MQVDLLHVGAEPIERSLDIRLRLACVPGDDADRGMFEPLALCLG
jgi:hypothetical protein